MPVLVLYSEYSRKDVHDIFSPKTLFTPSSGTWGLHGIVEIENHPGDFVFFVTFGQSQSGHLFDEWITEEGVFSWQSQPRQSLEDRRIQQFIHQHEKKNSIHLFLRSQRSANYTYFGKLTYLSHDPSRERPVYMYWQLAEWPIPSEMLVRLNLHLQPASIYRQGTVQTTESKTGNDRKNTSFFWRGTTWPIDRQIFLTEVRDRIKRGLPNEAIRYRDWYIDIDGQKISPKWLFHLITNAGYSEFDAPLAREKLAKLGLIAVQVKANSIFGGTNQIKGSRMNPARLKPSDRQTFFKKISQILVDEFPDTFRQVRYRFPIHENWFEIHYPNLKGYYCLRFARQFDEFAYYFQNGSENASLIVQQFTPLLPSLSKTLGYPVTVDLHSTKTWGRLGFEINNSVQKHHTDLEREQTIYARLLGIFIQNTLDTLVELPRSPRRMRSDNMANPKEDYISQIQLLHAKLILIHQVIRGSTATPSDEVLCDWIHFCYEFELYEEGQVLFTLVASNQVNPWLYDRTRKLARMCSIRANKKD